MKETKAFETTDGELFANEGDALKHQCNIDILNLLQEDSFIGTGSNKKVNLKTVSDALVKNCVKFADVLSNYNREFCRINKISCNN